MCAVALQEAANCTNCGNIASGHHFSHSCCCVENTNFTRLKLLLPSALGCRFDQIIPYHTLCTIYHQHLFLCFVDEITRRPLNMQTNCFESLPVHICIYLKPQVANIFNLSPVTANIRALPSLWFVDLYLCCGWFPCCTTAIFDLLLWQF